MSTIPTTFNERRVDYTVAGGGSPARGAEPFSLLLLNRGSRHLRKDPYEALERFRFASIVTIETGGGLQEAEALCARHPSLRIVSLRDRISPGEAVNIGMKESAGEFVLVMWSDMALSMPPVSASLLERFRKGGSVCVAPLLLGDDGKALPSMVIPALDRGRSLKLLSIAPEREGEGSLFPWDYAGIYDRDRFILTGGYDHGLESPWWQKADFGFRAHLWGERIRHDPAVKLSYESVPPAEDASPGPDYARFYLKNLAVRRSGDSGSLPLSRFWPWARSSRFGLPGAWREFSAARAWVRVNRFRFLIEARAVADLWEVKGAAE